MNLARRRSGLSTAYQPTSMDAVMRTVGSLSSLAVLVWCAGCATPALVTFPPARQITSIEVFEGLATEDAPHSTIRDPEKIESILAFLHDQEGKWDKPTSTSGKGRYHITFVGNDVRMFLRTGNGALQVQGADYDVHYKDLSEDEQEKLLKLLAIDDVPASETGGNDPSADLFDVPEQSETADAFDAQPAGRN